MMVRQIKRLLTHSLLVGLALLPISACTQERPVAPPVLPLGVDKAATPKIVVSNVSLAVDGRVVFIRKSNQQDWLSILGQAREDDSLFNWDKWGLQLLVTERDGKPWINDFSIYVRRSKHWESFAAVPGSSFLHERPENTFPGYLEIDGVPIGPNMTLTEIQQWRKFLGLVPLEPSMGYYRTGEDGKWAQHYFFEDDDKLTYVKFM